MDLANQALTIVAVLLGALTSYATGYMIERSKERRAVLTRWDAKKLETYVAYVGRVRDLIYAAVLLFEVREGIRVMEKSNPELTLSLFEAERSRALAFEQLMMLAGPEVIAVAHELNRSVVAIDWHARGLVEGSLQEWRNLHIRAFELINQFHERARVDLGVVGNLTAEHSPRALNLPPPRQVPSGSD